MKRAAVPGLARVLEEDVYPHCFTTTDREVGGVLVGSINPGSPPTIRASIRAAGAAETAAQLTFTQDTWQHIHQALEDRYPGSQIVGWYHTHPGYGLFLSKQDLFIHRNFFSNAGQIALVIDPVAGEEALFAWSGGEIREYYRRPTTFRPVDQRRDAPSRARAPSRGSPSRSYPPPMPPGTPPIAEAAAAPSTPAAHRLATWIYLAIIGMSMGVVFWELVLR